MRTSLTVSILLSVLQKLERTGWLRHERQGRRHRYRVVTSRRQATIAATRKFVERVYHGDPAAVLRLIDDGRAAGQGRPSLRDLVDLRKTVA